MKDLNKKIVCAAVKFNDGFIAVGSRHFGQAMIDQLKAVYGDNHKNWWPKELEQGFINTWDEFLSREEAAKVATKLKQCEPTDYLYSEDLY